MVATNSGGRSHNVTCPCGSPSLSHGAILTSSFSFFLFLCAHHKQTAQIPRLPISTPAPSLRGGPMCKTPHETRFVGQQTLACVCPRCVRSGSLPRPVRLFPRSIHAGKEKKKDKKPHHEGDVCLWWDDQSGLISLSARYVRCHRCNVFSGIVHSCCCAHDSVCPAQQ